ncbi:MAG: Maf family protein [Deltaproteobacteria bacterium]|nr:Maf family protein [Deltaproteobacteria bacterium]
MWHRISPQAPLILGSQSPRRAELLAQCQIPFEVFVAPIDERLQPGERHDALATRLARQKGAATLYAYQRAGNDATGRLFLCADTIVHFAGELLGKPRDAEDAKRMLHMLSGRTHQVTTGFVLHGSDLFDTPAYAETSAVTFRSLRDEEIKRYVATQEGLDKAGGYAIQGLAGAFCERIEGSYSNIVGLPIHRVVEILLELGVIDGFPLGEAT